MASTVELLIHSDTTDGSTTVVDSSLNNRTLTLASVEHSTDYAKWGTSSLLFSSKGSSSISTPISWEEAREFTLDFWVYKTTDGYHFRPFVWTDILYCLYSTTFNDSSFTIQLQINGSTEELNVPDNTIPLNQWTHIGLSASLTEGFRVWADGVLIDTNATAIIGSGITLIDKSFVLYGFSTNIYYDEVHLLIGEAVDFTGAVPTAAYEDPISGSSFEGDLGLSVDGSWSFYGSDAFKLTTIENSIGLDLEGDLQLNPDKQTTISNSLGIELDGEMLFGSMVAINESLGIGLDGEINFYSLDQFTLEDSLGLSLSSDIKIQTPVLCKIQSDIGLLLDSGFSFDTEQNSFSLQGSLGVEFNDGIDVNSYQTFTIENDLGIQLISLAGFSENDNCSDSISYSRGLLT